VSAAHTVIVARCDSFLSDEDPWWEGRCVCGWVADDTTEQGVWDAFNTHLASAAGEGATE
jgi:hypothetical protein